MGRELLRLEGLRKSYPGRKASAVAIAGPVSLLAGETLVIVGPSGAGKSTLLRMLALVEAPSEGKLDLFGEQVYGEKGGGPILALRRRLAMVFQGPILLRGSVRANVAYGLAIRGVKGAERQERVERALRQVGLADLAGASAQTLSGGEAQRVALARALVLEPEALLLDEPTANLDPYNVSVVEQIIRDLHGNETRGKETGLLIVTHNLFQARRLADRVGLMLNGELVELAEREAFFEAPQDPRTRAFVRGEMAW